MHLAGRYIVRRVRCSVDSQLRVRVTDAALSRDLFPADYDQHGAGDSEWRPTRWMALESLVDRRASSASDMARNKHNSSIDPYINYSMLVCQHAGRSLVCCYSVVWH